MRWLAGLLLLLPGAFGCSCTEDSPPCERFPLASAVFIGTVLARHDISGGRYPQGTLYLTRVEEAFRGLTTQQKEVFIDPGSFTSCYTDYEPGRTYLFYAFGMGNVVAASMLGGPGPVKALPAEWAEKMDLKVYSAMMCSGSKWVEHAGTDIDWIRRALRGETTTRVYGVAYQLYSQYAGEEGNVTLAGARIALQGVSGPALAVQSGPDGQYSFEGVPPGEYRLWGERPPWIGSARHRIRVGAGGCIERPLRLQSNGSVQGVLRKADGTPAKDVRVELVRVMGDGRLAKSYSIRSDTDAEGRFSLREAPGGRFVVGVNVRSPATVAEPWPATYFPGVPSQAAARVFDLEPNGTVAGLKLKLPRPMAPNTLRVRVFWADGAEAIGARAYADPVEQPHELNMFTKAQGGNVVTLRVMPLYSYRVRADWFGSNHFTSKEVVLPRAMGDRVVDLRLNGNRPVSEK